MKKLNKLMITGLSSIIMLSTSCSYDEFDLRDVQGTPGFSLGGWCRTGSNDMSYETYKFIDGASGKPIPGVEVHIYHTHPQSGNRSVSCIFKGYTNAHGQITWEREPGIIPEGYRAKKDGFVTMGSLDESKSLLPTNKMFKLTKPETNTSNIHPDPRIE